MTLADMAHLAIRRVRNEKSRNEKSRREAPRAEKMAVQDVQGA